MSRIPQSDDVVLINGIPVEVDDLNETMLEPDTDYSELDFDKPPVDTGVRCEYGPRYDLFEA